jgi:hypothetical protein
MGLPSAEKSPDSETEMPIVIGVLLPVAPLLLGVLVLDPPQEARPSMISRRKQVTLREVVVHPLSRPIIVLTPSREKIEEQPVFFDITRVIDNEIRGCSPKRHKKRY